MTLEERERILDAIATADGGCSSCVAGLLDVLAATLPDTPWKRAFGDLNYETIRLRERRAHKAMWGNTDDDTETGSAEK